MESGLQEKPLVAYVIDDDEGVRSLLSDVLEPRGYEVRCFGSADEARIALTQAALVRAPVDVVLLDMRLQAGSESTREAEALLDALTERQPAPSVIVMSGHLSSDEFMHLILRGATDFLTKPWEMRDLLTRVGNCADAGRQKYVHHYSSGSARSRRDRDAFLSYSSRNADLALGLKRMLERMGVSTWYAPADLSPGDEWHDSLNTAIHACRVFIVLLTPEAMASLHVMAEVQKALVRRQAQPHKFLVIPTACGIPVDSLPERLSALQTIDLSNRYTLVDNMIRLADRISQFTFELRAAEEDDRRRNDRRVSDRRRRATAGVDNRLPASV